MRTDAFERAEPGAKLVVPMAARKTVSLRTYLERIITKAGQNSWSRFLQNLRVSCETDWVEKYPSHVVAGGGEAMEGPARTTARLEGGTAQKTARRA